MTKPIPMLEPMTVREREVVELIVEGKCNKIIAREMNITLRTVKAHVTNVMRKMGVTSRYQVAVATQLIRNLVGTKHEKSNHQPNPASATV